MGGEAIPMRSALVAAAAAALVAGAGHAQTYPNGPITLVIPLTPGDATDIAARAMGDELAKLLRVAVIPLNRPGAGGALGTDSVVKAPKDGQTILITINAALTFRRVLEPQSVQYDPLKDLTPLGLTTRIPSILAVRDDLPYRNFAEMVEHLKKHPGTVRAGTVGIGSVGDFTVQIINALAGVELTMVPFKGASPAITALRGGHVEGVALALGALTGQLRSGAMRGIVMSSKFPEFPAIPTLSELGYRQNLLGVWLGAFAPAGVPAEVTSALVPAIEKVARDPTIAARLAALGMVQDYAAPDKLAEEIREEHRTVEQIAKRAGLIK
jgi:tripartite-type tricarboxylate transporter receptor subunit TctC